MDCRSSTDEPWFVTFTEMLVELVVKTAATSIRGDTVRDTFAYWFVQVTLWP